MKPYPLMIAAAAAMTLTPGCGRSSQPQRRSGAAATAIASPEDVARAAPYRLSGAALMMTPSEVASALKGDGYELSERGLDSQMTDSFEDRVQERLTGAAVPHPTKVPGDQTWVKGREKIHVVYGLYPGEPRVVSIAWATEDPSPTDSEIAATLEKRYGRGWRQLASIPEKWCSPMPCAPTSAMLSPGPRTIDLLAPVAMYEGQADWKRVEAAAQSRQGRKQGSF